MGDKNKPEVGWRVGNYRLVRVLGQGGMAKVFEAVNEHIGKRVAIKVMRPELSQNQELETRFLNEARSANLVQHPGLINIFESGRTEEGCTYIVMEYLDGESFSAYLHRAGKLAVADAVRLARQLASALAATHDKGIVHRDLKPSNVFVIRDSEAPGGERAKILDFGIAKVAAWFDGSEGEGLRTRTGALMGTPAYMAPEQCRESGKVGDRADVYSLGIIIYQALSGHPPFVGPPIELMMMQISQHPCPLRQLNPGVPEEVAALVHAMLAKRPQERPSMAQVEAELGRLGPRLAEFLLRGPAPSPSGPRGEPHGDPSALPISMTPSLPPSIPPSVVGAMAAETPEAQGRRGFWKSVLLVAVAGMVLGMVLQRRQAGLAPPARPRPPEERAVTSPAPRPPQRMVHWQLSSEPQGAQVIRTEADGERVLGTTPYVLLHEPGSGTQRLLLRLAGHADKAIEIDLGADGQTHALLDRLPAPPRPPDGPARHPPPGRKRPPPGTTTRHEISDEEVPLLP